MDMNRILYQIYKTPHGYDFYWCFLDELLMSWIFVQLSHYSTQSSICFKLSLLLVYVKAIQKGKALP